MKPTISAPFVLVFLFTGQWTVLVVTAAFCVVSSLVTWAVIRTNPVELLQQLSLVGEFLAPLGSPSLIQVFARLGLSTTSAMHVAAVSVTAILAGAMFARRKSSLLTLFGLATVGARLFTYHRHYDEAIIVFLLVALAALAARSGRAILWLAAAATYLSLGPPASILAIPVLQWLALVLWSVCAGVLFAQSRTEVSATPGRTLPQPGCLQAA
jgi:hypothetical protein